MLAGVFLWLAYTQSQRGKLRWQMRTEKIPSGLA